MDSARVNISRGGATGEMAVGATMAQCLSRPGTPSRCVPVAHRRRLDTQLCERYRSDEAISSAVALRASLLTPGMPRIAICLRSFVSASPAGCPESGHSGLERSTSRCSSRARPTRRAAVHGLNGRTLTTSHRADVCDRLEWSVNGSASALSWSPPRLSRMSMQPLPGGSSGGQLRRRRASQGAAEAPVVTPCGGKWSQAGVVNLSTDRR
jgi:hypothetical protein